MTRALGAAALAAVAVSAPAQAGEVMAGVYAHDADLHISICCYEHGADLLFGVRSDPFARLGRWGDLRAYGFGAVNTSGGVSFAAAGVAWRIPLGRRFYLQPGFGGAVHTGDDKKYDVPGKLELGSRFLFEPELALGVKLSDRWSAEASYIHLSHAQLAGPQNPGMDDIGVRAVYRFGP